MSQAASEETLKQLLEVSKTSSQNIIAMAQKMGVDLSGLGRSADESGGMLQKLGTKIGATAGAFAGVIKEINDFGRTAADSGVTVSSTYARIAGYFDTGLIKTAFTSIAALSQEFEKNQKIYNDLARNGATFGGSLADVATVSGKAFMTMEQFATVARNNTDVFRLLGTTTESGMNKFVSIQNGMLDQKSPYARNIIALTGNAQGAAEALTGYMRSQASMNKQSLTSNVRIIEGTIEYARELDTLSKITGKRKEQIEKEYQEVAAEESFQQYLSTLDADKADAARAAINSARQVFGKDVADQLRTAIQTGVSTPLTEGQQNMFLMTGGATQKFVEQQMQSVSEGKKVADIQREVIAAGRESYKFYSDFADQNNIVLGINAAFKTGLQASSAGVLGAMGRLRTDEEVLQKIKAEQDKQRTGSATALSLAELSLIEVGAKINELRKNVLDPIVSQLSDLTKDVAGVASKVFGSQMAQEATNFIGTAIKDLGDAINSGEIAAAFEKQLTGGSGILPTTARMVNAAGNAMVDGIKKVESIIGPYIAAGALTIIHAISEFAEIIPGRKTLEDKIKSKESEISQTEGKLSKTSMETEPLKYKELTDNLKKSQDELVRLKKDQEFRGMTYFEIVEKVKKETSPTVLPEKKSESPPGVPSTNAMENPPNQIVSPEEKSSVNTPGAKAGSLPPSERYAYAEQVDKLITSNKELSEILNNKLEELIKVARESNDTSSKTVTAINRLNNDGFAMVSG